LLRSATNLQQTVKNDVSNLKAAFDDKASKLRSFVDKQKSTVDRLRPKFHAEDLNVLVKQSLSASEQAKTAIESAVSEFDALKPDLEKLMNRSNEFVLSTSLSASSLSTAKEQILKLANESVPVREELELLRNAASNTSMAIQQCREKLNSLKEKIALARDSANRIKLGAHFEKGSSLELPLPPRITRLILFFGNELGAAGTRAVPTDDFIAVEVEAGHLKAVVDLGEEPAHIVSDSFVADGNWRRAAVERVGKAVKLRVSSPSSANYEEEKTVTVSGSKLVLNLHQKKSRLFVGGIAPDVKISPDVHNRDFSGDVEDLRIRGESVGLWNSKQGGNRNVQGATKKTIATTSMSDGLGSFSFILLCSTVNLICLHAALNESRQLIINGDA
uniref:LAM_G_DOMAIN domain-containing protein n=1 Tax=Gongylonema pulchrum TaxID=637853 RepID=A0A183E7R3_9BILA